MSDHRAQNSTSSGSRDIRQVNVPDANSRIQERPTRQQLHHPQPHRHLHGAFMEDDRDRSNRSGGVSQSPRAGSGMPRPRQSGQDQSQATAYAVPQYRWQPPPNLYPFNTQPSPGYQNSSVPPYNSGAPHAYLGPSFALGQPVPQGDVQQHMHPSSASWAAAPSLGSIAAAGPPRSTPAQRAPLPHTYQGYFQYPGPGPYQVPQREQHPGMQSYGTLYQTPENPGVPMTAPNWQHVGTEGLRHGHHQQDHMVAPAASRAPNMDRSARDRRHLGSPARVPSSAPTSQARISSQQRRLGNCGRFQYPMFPAKHERIPSGLSEEDIVRRYPNHLGDNVLQRLMDQGHSSRSIYDMMPQEARDWDWKQFVQRQRNAGKDPNRERNNYQPFSRIQKRMQPFLKRDDAGAVTKKRRQNPKVPSSAPPKRELRPAPNRQSIAPASSQLPVGGTNQIEQDTTGSYRRTFPSADVPPPRRNLQGDHGVEENRRQQLPSSGKRSLSTYQADDEFETSSAHDNNRKIPRTSAPRVQGDIPGLTPANSTPSQDLQDIETPATVPPESNLASQVLDRFQGFSALDRVFGFEDDGGSLGLIGQDTSWILQGRDSGQKRSTSDIPQSQEKPEPSREVDVSEPLPVPQSTTASDEGDISLSQIEQPQQIATLAEVQSGQENHRQANALGLSRESSSFDTVAANNTEDFKSHSDRAAEKNSSANSRKRKADDSTASPVDSRFGPSPPPESTQQEKDDHYLQYMRKQFIEIAGYDWFERNGNHPGSMQKFEAEFKELYQKHFGHEAEQEKKETKNKKRRLERQKRNQQRKVETNVEQEVLDKNGKTRDPRRFDPAAEDKPEHFAEGLDD
ncbi:MAG: hypothetical protein Q9227_001045 [Pyrenula ochraceoflavens]